MFVLARAVTYATVFVGFLLVFVPSRILSGAGITQPQVFGIPQIGGMMVGAIGALLVLWCLLAFAFVGKGTPAPFDPPRRLVIKGPYRYVRNPMYIGAGLPLAGAALYYQSLQLIAYTALFFLCTHIFVVFYEEPTLKQSFGQDFNDYCQKVRRWWPKI
jgi:protein-S-isoprenylcysteine O-methyltransferase Ste14